MYTYKKLIDDYKRLTGMGIKGGSIGKSVRGKSIPYLHVGDACGKQILIQGAIHAREWPTALLMIKQAEHLMRQSLCGGVYLVPMSNPDGNAIAEGIEQPLIDKSLLGDYDYRLYKANANGVDLNTNFDAQWGHGDSNRLTVGISDYIGEYPCSEPETQALKSFTVAVKPQLTISYHAKGQEVYYAFNQSGNQKCRDRRIASLAAEALGYTVRHDIGGIGYAVLSTGGYKDWCIGTLGIPALTIEIISDNFEHPLTADALAPDVDNNLKLPKILLDAL